MLYPDRIAARRARLALVRTSWILPTIAAGLLLWTPARLGGSLQPARGASFVSSGCGSCEYSHATSWTRQAGVDEDGVPDADDHVVIAPGDRVHVGSGGAAARTLQVQRGAELWISGGRPRRFLARGRVMVEGRFVVQGPHELVFESGPNALAGIHVAAGGELQVSGTEVVRGRIESVEDHEAVSLLALDGLPQHSGELAGATVHVLSGLARGLVFDVIGSAGAWLTVSAHSGGRDGNAGYTEAVFGRGAQGSTLFVPPELVAGRPVLERAEPYSARWVGRWLRFTRSGRQHLILQAVERRDGEAVGRLRLLPEPAPEDALSTFSIASGLAPGDEVVVFRPARATIPPENRASGRNHALLVAERARVLLKYAEFAYFGTRYDLEARLNGWPKEAGRSGLTFLDIDGRRPDQGLEMAFVQIHGGAAGAQVAVARSTGAAIRQTYTWDVHPAANAPGFSDAGHGWYFEHASGLVFEDNTVRNQGDDHVYLEGIVQDASFRRNILVTSPAGLGYSTSNIEGVLSGDSSRIVVEENICLAADGNVSFTFERRAHVQVRRNVIASAFDENAANLSLVNAEGEVADNVVMHGPLGVMIAGDSAVDVRRNLLRNHRLGVRNASRVAGNILIRSPVNLNTAFGTPEPPLRIESNLFAGAHPAYGRVLTVYDPAGAFAERIIIERNTLDAALAGGARGIAVEIATRVPVVVRGNIVLRAAVGLSDASARPVVASVRNWFVDMLNPSTGAPMNVLPSTLQEDGNVSAPAAGFSAAALGYGLRPASPAARDEVGFVCAGVTSTGPFPLPVEMYQPFIDVSGIATVACPPD